MATPVPGETLALSAADFDRLARFIHAYCGLKMPPSKQALVEGRLRRHVRDLGFADFHRYCGFLFEEGGLDREVGPIIDAVTTHKTSFFREPEHYRFLAEVVAPERAALGSGTLRLWSSACSTGPEPYTMAMVMDRFAERRRGLDFAITATDVSAEAVATARLGIYPAEAEADIPPEYRHYLMQARPGRAPACRVVPELRRKVRFGHLNLTDEAYGLDRDFDVIFCRNVLIYFERALQAMVLARLCAHLLPGGYLMIGHSESINGLNLPLRQVAPTIFVKEATR